MHGSSSYQPMVFEIIAKSESYNFGKLQLHWKNEWIEPLCHELNILLRWITVNWVEMDLVFPLCALETQFLIFSLCVFSGQECPIIFEILEWQNCPQDFAEKMELMLEVFIITYPKSTDQMLFSPSQPQDNLLNGIWRCRQHNLIIIYLISNHLITNQCLLIKNPLFFKSHSQNHQQVPNLSASFRVINIGQVHAPQPFWSVPGAGKTLCTGLWLLWRKPYPIFLPVDMLL